MTTPDVQESRKVREEGEERGRGREPQGIRVLALDSQAMQHFHRRAGTDSLPLGFRMMQT